eukprot:7311866-Heterocapsa_arctica.AAC.1
MENRVPGLPSTKEDHAGGERPHALGQQPGKDGQDNNPGPHEWQCGHRSGGDTRQHQTGTDHS